MINSDHLFEDALIKCIELFKQYELYNEDSKKEDGVSSLISAQKLIDKQYYLIQAPKWGYCLEYL